MAVNGDVFGRTGFPPSGQIAPVNVRRNRGAASPMAAPLSTCAWLALPALVKRTGAGRGNLDRNLAIGLGDDVPAIGLAVCQLRDGLCVSASLCRRGAYCALTRGRPKTHWAGRILATPEIGGWLASTAIGILAALTTWQHRKGRTVIPAHVWAALFSIPAILQLALVSQSLFAVVMLTGVMVTLILLMAWERVTVTLTGLVLFLLISGLLLLCFRVDVWVGRGATVMAGLGWWHWGKKFLWVPPSFWLVTILGVLGAVLVRQSLVAETWAALGFGLLTLGLWWWEKRKRG